MSTTQKTIFIDYTNHRGERSWRCIIPEDHGLRFGSTEWHKEPQWLLLAYDTVKESDRAFALKHIHAIRAEAP